MKSYGAATFEHHSRLNLSLMRTNARAIILDVNEHQMAIKWWLGLETGHDMHALIKNKKVMCIQAEQAGGCIASNLALYLH